jgi:hypothetical protein
MELRGSHAAVRPNNLCDEIPVFRPPVRLSALLRLDTHENNLCESLRYHNRLGNGLPTNCRMIGY